MIARGVRMLGFHVRLFARNSYFAQLLITSTISVLLLQWVASFGGDAEVSSQAWLRAGMVGTWTTCAVSTGLVGFQRFQGTLVYLVTARVGPRAALLPVVGSAATFGLLSFPLAAAAAALLGLPLGDITWTRLLAMGILWLASVSVSLVIAATFAHSPDALVYESLVAAPIVLLSGMFGFPERLAMLEPLLRVLPLKSAVDALAEGTPSVTFWVDCAVAILTSAGWILAASAISRAAVRRAIQHATSEVT